MVQEEWPRLADRNGRGESGWSPLRQLRAASAAPPEATPAQEVTALELLAQLGALDEARRSRESDAQETLSPALWSGIVIGAFLSICILFFFKIGCRPSQLVMAMGMVGLTVFLGLLIRHLASPFGEVMGVTVPNQ